jgi:putative transposase
MKYGSKAGTQYYKCNDCHRKFAGRIAPEGMRFSTATIGESLGLFYDGLSLSDISRHLQVTQAMSVDPSSVWHWVIRYSKEANRVLDKVKVKTSWQWIIDETMIKVEGQNAWLWDVIDFRTRFLLATHLTVTRTIKSAVAVLSQAQSRSLSIPKRIVSDGMKAYPEAIEQVFGADSSHIVAKGLTAEVNTNVVERFQGTVKERTKVMRGLKTMETAKIISEGFIVHYNFLRPHMTLNGKTPAKAAGLNMPFKTWIELVDYLSRG